MSILSRIFGKGPVGMTDVRPLWHRIVEIAREKEWYRECGIADTINGRFDAITLVLAIFLLRMESEQALVEPSVRLAELFVDDMEGQLRQSGVGDLSVGKQVGKLMSVLGGRLGALRDAMPEGGDAVAAAIERNIALNEGTDPHPAARRTLELASQLDKTPAEDILAARIGR